MKITYNTERHCYVCEYAGIRRSGVTYTEALNRVLSILLYVRSE